MESRSNMKKNPFWHTNTLRLPPAPPPCDICSEPYLHTTQMEKSNWKLKKLKALSFFFHYLQSLSLSLSLSIALTVGPIYQYLLKNFCKFVLKVLFENLFWWTQIYKTVCKWVLRMHFFIIMIGDCQCLFSFCLAVSLFIWLKSKSIVGIFWRPF